MYKELIDVALRNIQEAREMFMQKYDEWDIEWCVDRFDGVMDALEMLRDVFDEPKD